MGDIAERFYMLAVFIWASALQASTWGPIVAAPDASKHCFPGLTDSDILMQLNWGPIIQMPFVIVAMRVLSGQNGLQRCVRIGVLLAVASAAIRMIASLMPGTFRHTTTARLMLQVAGMVCGASGGFLQGCPSRFSALWFPPQQRARATGSAFVGIGLGQALTYVACPLLVHRVDQLANLLAFQVAFAIPPLLCCFVYFPDRPLRAWWLQTTEGESTSLEAPNAVETVIDQRSLVSLTDRPSLPVTESSALVLRLTLSVLRQLSSMLLAVLCGLVNGPYQSWGAALPTILGNLHYSSSDKDMFSFGSLFAYTVGSYTVGELGDRVFQGHFKQLLGWLLLLALSSFIWLCLMLPTSFQPVPLLHGGFPTVLLAVALTGWFVGATNPICMELCAELTYPTPEGISGNIIIFITQAFSVVMLAVVPHLDPLVTTPCMAGVVLLCILLLLPVREQYLRFEAEKSLQAKQAAQSQM